MININSALQSIPLALLSAEKNVAISPVSNTPVGELVKISNDMLQLMPKCQLKIDITNVDGESELRDLADVLANYTSSKVTQTAHDTKSDWFIDLVSKAVSAHISYAKNVVRPVIMDMVDAVTKGSISIGSPSADFCVEVSDIPKPMQNTSFESSLNKYKEKAYIPATMEFRMAEISPQGILELLKTGSAEMDGLVSEWFASMGDQFFMDIWNNIFRDFKESKPELVFTLADRYKTPLAVDTHLAVLLLCRKLIDSIPDVTGMDLKLYKSTMQDHIDASSVIIANEYTRYDSVMKNKSLVISYAPDDRSCKVNGAIYRDWLKAGGSNEVLLGMLAGGVRLFTLAMIEERKEEFIRNWNSFVSFNKAASKNKSFIVFKDILRIAFFKEMSLMSEEEKSNVSGMDNYLGKVKTKFEDQLDILTTRDMEDTYEVCTKLICRSRFYYTEAEKILVGINEAVRTNPGIDIREAALLSTIEYVVDYFSAQMQITSI